MRLPDVLLLAACSNDFISSISCLLLCLACCCLLPCLPGSCLLLLEACLLSFSLPWSFCLHVLLFFSVAPCFCLLACLLACLVVTLAPYFLLPSFPVLVLAACSFFPLLLALASCFLLLLVCPLLLVMSSLTRSPCCKRGRRIFASNR